MFSTRSSIMAAEALTRSIATLNLDHTTRAPEISTQQTLCAGVVQTLGAFAEAPDIVSMVEVSGKTWVRLFQESTRYDGVQTPNGYTRGGTNYIAWDRDKYACSASVTSHAGRYCGVILDEVGVPEPQKLFHLAVHLPTKGDWESQARLVASTVEWGRLQGVHAVSIAGDFNKRPEDVLAILADVGLRASILSSDGVATTKKGNCIDNVLLDVDAVVHTAWVQTGNELFSHHPLSVVAEYSK